MRYSVATAITPRAAARLLISNEMDPAHCVSGQAAAQILDELAKLPIDECLSIVDNNKYGDVADVKGIPQFGTIETLMRVPHFFSDKGVLISDYPQMGFYLKNDISASLGANTKFGENHGKTMALLGIIQCANCRFSPTALSDAFCKCSNEEKQQIMARLFFRIPIIQIILKNASVSEFNGFYPMCQLMESTRHRRGFNLRAIFEELQKLNHKELSRRIENIVWTDCEEVV